jgi:hypothetical protein
MSRRSHYIHLGRSTCLLWFQRGRGYEVDQRCTTETRKKGSGQRTLVGHMAFSNDAQGAPLTMLQLGQQSQFTGTTVVPTSFWEG